MSLDISALRQQLQQMINEFNAKMAQEGKPISLELRGNVLVFRYKNALEDLFKKLQETGLQTEVIATETSIMVKIPLSELKKLIVQRSGLKELENSEIRVEGKDLVGEIRL